VEMMAFGMRQATPFSSALSQLFFKQDPSML